MPLLSSRDASVDARLDAQTYYEPNTGCWLWLGLLTRSGYGRITYKGRSRTTHTLTWELEHGHPPPAGLHLDHLCRQRVCRSPYHLEPVTPHENLRRSSAPCSTALRTNHCLHGHELTPENTYWNRKGWRQCRACTTARHRAEFWAIRDEYNAKHRAQRLRDRTQRRGIEVNDAAPSDDGLAVVTLNHPISRHYGAVRHFVDIASRSEDGTFCGAYTICGRPCGVSTAHYQERQGTAATCRTCLRVRATTDADDRAPAEGESA